MNCPSELTCSLYVDGVIEASAAADVERHLQTCAACAARVAGLHAESVLLRRALQAEEPVAVPPFERPLGAPGAFGFAVAAIGAAWLVAGTWESVLGSVPPGLDWLNPFQLGNVLDVFITAVLFGLREGTEMFGNIVNSISVVSVVALGTATALIALKNRRGAAVASSLLLLAVGLPDAGHAIEIRREAALVTVAAGETVDDTLVIFSESAAIDGNVNGDVVAFTRTLTVRGRVAGNVVGFAQTIEIEGDVGGTVHAFARSIDVRSPVARNVFAFASDITLGNGSDVRGNAVLFAANAAVRGRVGNDVTAFAADLEIGGDVTGDVEAHAQRVRVLAPGRIGGDLRARTGDPQSVQVASGATIGGRTDVQVDEALEQESEYFQLSFYFGQVLRVCAAFIVGLLLLWLFPALRTVTLRSGADALKAGGVGLATAILLPIASLLAVITVIGIPLGIVGFIVWLLALYLAKIVVAFLVGRRLFESPSGNMPHHAALLISGLVIVTIAVNVPFVGGIVNVVLVLLGVGLLVLHLAGRHGRATA